MKKIAISLMIISLAAAAFAAAPKKSAPAASTKSMYLDDVVVLPGRAKAVPVQSNRIGVIIAGVGGIGTLGMNFNPNLSGDLGLAISQNAAGAATNIRALIRLEYALGSMGGLKTHTGGNLLFASNPGYAAAATSSLTLNGFAGVEYELTNNLAVLLDLTVLEITSTGGATSFGIGAGTAGGTGVTGINPLTIYGGARLYI